MNENFSKYENPNIVSNVSIQEVYDEKLHFFGKRSMFNRFSLAIIISNILYKLFIICIYSLQINFLLKNPENIIKRWDEEGGLTQTTYFQSLNYFCKLRNGCIYNFILSISVLLAFPIINNYFDSIYVTPSYNLSHVIGFLNTIDSLYIALKYLEVIYNNNDIYSMIVIAIIFVIIYLWVFKNKSHLEALYFSPIILKLSEIFVNFFHSYKVSYPFNLLRKCIDLLDDNFQKELIRISSKYGFDSQKIFFDFFFTKYNGLNSDLFNSNIIVPFYFFDSLVFKPEMAIGYIVHELCRFYYNDYFIRSFLIFFKLLTSIIVGVFVYRKFEKRFNLNITVIFTFYSISLIDKLGSNLINLYSNFSNSRADDCILIENKEAFAIPYVEFLIEDLQISWYMKELDDKPGINPFEYIPAMKIIYDEPSLYERITKFKKSIRK